MTDKCGFSGTVVPNAFPTLYALIYNYGNRVKRTGLLLPFLLHPYQLNHRIEGRCVEKTISDAMQPSDGVPVI